MVLLLNESEDAISAGFVTILAIWRKKENAVYNRGTMNIAE